MSDKDLSKKAANEQLMSCPFCGGKARVSEHVVPVTRFLDFGRRKMTSEFKYGIACQKCGAMSSQYYETMEEAVVAWNTRIPVSHKISAVEYLKVREQMASELAELCSACHCEGKCWECPYHAPDIEDEMQYPDRSIAIVEKWAKEHPERNKE